MHLPHRKSKSFPAGAEAGQLLSALAPLRAEVLGAPEPRRALGKGLDKQLIGL